MSGDDADLLVNNRYQIIHKIGNGTFGMVVFGKDIVCGSNVALKLEPMASNSSRLKHEFRVYKAMKGQIGFPEVFWNGRQDNFHILSMELLGPSLEDLFNFCNRQFSLKTVLLLADQLLTRIEALHRMGFVHRDIKAENFVMGLSSNDKTVFMIDMGLSKKYRIGNDVSEHIPFAEGRAFCGTMRFASLNAHDGFELSRRDDLISLGYTLIYFLKGDLPWFKLKSKMHTKQEFVGISAAVKREFRAEKLCRDCPQEFASFLNHCETLRFDETPNYPYLKRLFWNLFVSNDFVFDGMFDWHLFTCTRNSHKNPDIKFRNL